MHGAGGQQDWVSSSPAVAGRDSPGGPVQPCLQSGCSTRLYRGEIHRSDETGAERSELPQRAGQRLGRALRLRLDHTNGVELIRRQAIPPEDEWTVPGRHQE